MSSGIFNRTTNKQLGGNGKLYVGVGTLTMHKVYHIGITAQPVLLRCTSGLAQSFSNATPISLTRRCGLSPKLAAPSFLFKGRGRDSTY